MSSVKNTQWPSTQTGNLQSKYEKCRNITEEIYKRINITFEIKKLETAEQSDVSVNSIEIDSNDLSNDTDLFACDKSDSIPSSTEADRLNVNPKVTVTKFININNNEERNKTVYKRPKKKFRKRVKKRQNKPDQADASSDEEVMPLSRMAASPEPVCTVPNIIIVTKGLTPKILQPDVKRSAKRSPKQKHSKEITSTETSPSSTNNKESTMIEKTESIDTIEVAEEKEKTENSCSMCGQTYKSERGLRRHMALSHIACEDTTRPEREVKPA